MLCDEIGSDKKIYLQNIYIIFLNDEIIIFNNYLIVKIYFLFSEINKNKVLRYYLDII